MVGTKESAAKSLQTKQEKQITYARITGLPVGCEVRVDTPREKRYHGRKGRVSEHSMGEIGVDFGSSPAVWFLKNQLIRVGDGSKSSPSQ